MDGMTGLTQPERILRALSFRGDGTPAPPGELTLSGARLRERTGIKSSSMYVVTRRLRNEGKIERDGRGRWRLPARRQMADNGHRSAEATRAAGAENGTESVSGNGSTANSTDGAIPKFEVVVAGAGQAPPRHCGESLRGLVFSNSLIEHLGAMGRGNRSPS